MKVIYSAICGMILTMSSLARAEHSETGDNWISWTFEQGDFHKPFGKQTNFGWGTEMKPYIQVGCFVVTPKKTFVGPGTLDVEVAFAVESFVWVPDLQQRPTAGIAAPIVTYQDDAGQSQVASPIAALEATDAPHWDYFSSDGAHGGVYRVWTDHITAKDILPQGSEVHGNAQDVTVSICNIMDRVELSIHAIKVKFTKR